MDRSHIHVANIVVSPKGREVSIRVMNSSEEPIEVMKGQKIATFQQLTEIRPKPKLYCFSLFYQNRIYLP